MKIAVVYLIFFGGMGIIIGILFAKFKLLKESVEAFSAEQKIDNQHLKIGIREMIGELKFLSKVVIEKKHSDDPKTINLLPLKGGNRKGRSDEQRAAAAEKKKQWWADKKKKEAEASPKGAIPLPYQKPVISSTISHRSP